MWRSGEYIDLEIVFDEYDEEEVNKKNEEINKEYQYGYDDSNKDAQNDNNSYNYQYGNRNDSSSLEDFLLRLSKNLKVSVI